MKWQVLLLLLIGGLVYAKVQINQESARRVEYKRAIATGTDVCAGKQFCIITYVAPWCPACKSIIPRLMPYLEKARRHEKYGMKIIVGQGEKPEDNETLAARFGAAGVVDADGSLARKLSVGKYPSFYVVDKDFSVILADQEAVQWMSEKL